MRNSRSLSSSSSNCCLEAEHCSAQATDAAAASGRAALKHLVLQLVVEQGAHVISSRASRSRSAAAGFLSRLSASGCVACMAVLSLASKAQVRSRAVLTPADSASC